jgi:SAM-dependent methyltransferase
MTSFSEGPGVATPEPWMPLAEALAAYRDGDHDACVIMHTDAGPPGKLPMALFFRPASSMDAIDLAALDLCEGRVLEVGAAAGAMTLALEARGREVTAIDPLPVAVQVMRQRGVTDPRRGDGFTFRDGRFYDTVLLIMNGSMIAGTLSGLRRLLMHLAGLLSEGGSILMDSTDLSEGRSGKKVDGRYVGELHYQLEFAGRKGPPFPQLFVDPDTLTAVAGSVGLEHDVVSRGGEGRFLSRLTRRP